MNRSSGCADGWGMNTHEGSSVEREPKPDDVLARIAVSASELSGVFHPEEGSEIADAIARVLAERVNQAA